MATTLSTKKLAVRCAPELSDPSELTSILITSIRSLFGELEFHSFGMTVTKAPNKHHDIYHFIIECQPQSIDSIRASLTMVTTPCYLESSVYRFDSFILEEETG
jgi:RNase P/RNase MRP subunit POP5